MNLESEKAWFADFLQTMLEAGHTTSWSTGTRATKNDGKESPFFLFLTFDEEIIKEVREVLNAHGLLCATVLAGPKRFNNGQQVSIDGNQP